MCPQKNMEINTTLMNIPFYFLCMYKLLH